MKLKIAVLEESVQIMFRHLRALGVESVNLDHDYYWSISTAEQYNPYENPQNLTLGQLTDDLNALTDLVGGSDEPLAYHFVLLAELLSYVGRKVVG